MSEESFPLFDAHMHFSHAYLDQVLENIYGPWRRRLRALELSDATLRKITRENGERYFLQNVRPGSNK